MEQQKKIKPHTRNKASNISYMLIDEIRSYCKKALYREYLKDRKFNANMLKIFKLLAKREKKNEFTRAEVRIKLLDLCYEHGLVLPEDDLICDFFLKGFHSWQEKGSPEYIPANMNIEAKNQFFVDYLNLLSSETFKIELGNFNFVWEMGTGQTRGDFTRKAIKKFTSKLDEKLDELEKKVTISIMRRDEFHEFVEKHELTSNEMTSDEINMWVMSSLRKFRGLSPINTTAIRWLYRKLRGHSWNQIAKDAFVSISTVRSEVKKVAKILGLKLSRANT